MAAKEKSAADAVLDADPKGGVAVVMEPETPAGSVSRIPLKHIKAVKECKELRGETDDDKSFDSLVTSIKLHGILVPLLVESADGNGTFNLIGGYRRYAAAKQLGLEDVPVISVDTEAQAEAVGKLLGRQRPSNEMVRQVVGLVDNTARQALNELDLIAQIRWLIASDNEGRFKRGGSINATALQKALGTGYEYMRNRVHVIENFTEKECADIQKAIDKGLSEKGGIQLNWSKVWAVLRKGGKHLEVLKDLIWGTGKGEKEGDDEATAKKRKAAKREIVSLKRGVRSQALEDAGIAVKLIGAPGTKNYEAEVTVRTRLKGTSFAQERGTENVTSLFEMAMESLGEFKKLKDPEAAKAMRESFDSALQGLKARLL